MTGTSPERWTVVFTGRVQGVFFRATTRQVATNHPVTGWVRNEADGSVCVVAEGAPAALRAFIDDVEDAKRGNIDGVEIRCVGRATGEFTRFEVRR